MPEENILPDEGLSQLMAMLQQTGDEPPPSDEATPSGVSQAFGAAQLLSAMLSQPKPQQAEGESAGPTRQPERAPQGAGLSAVAEMLPQLLQAVSGEPCSLSAERLDLVRALKPYAASHGTSIERAIKMAGVAKAAKGALNALGKK